MSGKVEHVRSYVFAGAVYMLRVLLEELGTERAQFYRPHDLRRGHAEDLRLKGSPLWMILAAGEWRSPAFLSYLDVHKMEVESVLQGVLDEESDCPEEASESKLDHQWLKEQRAARKAAACCVDLSD